MHHCLFINEILEAIAWDISLAVYTNDHPSKTEELRPMLSDRKSLLAFILTCRTFCEPGLNVLWYQLDGISPLAYTFHSSSIVKIDRGPTIYGHVEVIPSLVDVYQRKIYPCFILDCGWFYAHSRAE